MKRYVLLAGVATALAIAPTAAFAGSSGGNDGHYDDTITFGNHVSTTVYNASYDFDLTYMIGGVRITGEIDPNSAAKAITDAKQLMTQESVSFSDPASSNNNDDNGCGGDSKCNDKNDKDKGGSSNPATVRNNATAGNVTSDGNTGVNVAAGQYNMQQNSANIAVSADDGNHAKGWASAATTGYQSLTDTNYGETDSHGNDKSKDNGNKDGGHYNDRNNATSGRVDSDGNVGVNVAAGAFNQQQNLLTLAVANNAVLAQSNAVLWQTASCNTVDIQDQRNNAESGNVTGAGNIGVNVAAGVGNQQQNSLTAAVSGPFGS